MPGDWQGSHLSTSLSPCVSVALLLFLINDFVMFCLLGFFFFVSFLAFVSSLFRLLPYLYAGCQTLVADKLITSSFSSIFLLIL